MMNIKRQGNAFEQEIDELNAIYNRQGRAYVVKTPDPIHIQGRTGSKVYGVMTAAKMTDFSGVLKGGQAVVFDAKTTTHERLFSMAELKKARKGGRKQIEILEDNAKLGAICFVLLSHQPPAAKRSIYLLPVELITSTLEQGAASLKLSELDRYKLKPQYGWLEKLSELYGGGGGGQSKQEQVEAAPEVDLELDPIDDLVSILPARVRNTLDDLLAK